MWVFGPLDPFGHAPCKSRSSHVDWAKLIGLKLTHVIMYEIQNLTCVGP